MENKILLIYLLKYCIHMGHFCSQSTTYISLVIQTVLTIHHIHIPCDTDCAHNPLHTYPLWYRLCSQSTTYISLVIQTVLTIHHIHIPCDTDCAHNPLHTYPLWYRLCSQSTTYISLVIQTVLTIHYIHIPCDIDCAHNPPHTYPLWYRLCSQSTTYVCSFLEGTRQVPQVPYLSCQILMHHWGPTQGQCSVGKALWGWPRSGPGRGYSDTPPNFCNLFS